MSDLQKLKELRSFLIEQAVHLRGTEANKVYFYGLNLLYLDAHGRSPTLEEWTALEALTQELFSHLSDPLRRRFVSSRLPWWVAWLMSGLGLVAILALIECTLTWGIGSYARIIPWYVLWLMSLGAIGSISFIGMNALSLQDDATFDLTNSRLLVLRIVLGSLFGLVLSLPFGFRSFVNFISFLLRGGVMLTQDISASAGPLVQGSLALGENLIQQSALLLLPFILGFSTSLVIMILNRFVDAAQTFFGKKADPLISRPAERPRVGNVSSSIQDL